MHLEIKNKIERELYSFIRDIDRLYHLNSISPILFKNIKEFLCRKGKRVRPILFVIGYLGYAKKTAQGLYRSAVSIELLHDFMLVHDDIIDKSDTRRGKPSMHALLNRYLKGYKDIKFTGEDLTIVAGDVMYAMALYAFLSIKEDKQRKENALKKLIQAALYTGSGEFLELIYGLKQIDCLSLRDIYKVYDLKTANYTFASPLTIGATLAGANKSETERLFKYGIYLGRAFQIKDDILGLFSEEAEIGKSNLADIQEAKKTILLWYAYSHAVPQEKRDIERILSKKNVKRMDLLEMRRIVSNSGALDYATKQVQEMLKDANKIHAALRMNPKYKKLLACYSQKILSL